MASPSYFLFVISLCVSVTLLYPISCYGQNFPGQPLFVFGDSLYDPGNIIFFEPNTGVSAYRWPYGITSFDHPTGRFSDGLIIPDFLAERRLNVPFIPPGFKPGADFTNGANYAVGGSGVLDIHPTMNLEDQIMKFKELKGKWTRQLGEHETKERVRKGVYLFCMGGNDYFRLLNDPDTTEAEEQEYVNNVIGIFKNLVKETYELGARKFVFQNVAPIGCLPMMKQRYEIFGDECAEIPVRVSIKHNIALSKVAKELESELSGFKYSIFDFFTLIGDRIKNPTNYGMKQGDVACCGTGTHRASSCASLTVPFELCDRPDDNVFFDGGHPSQHSNVQLANAIWNGAPDVAGPYNMEQLFELDSIRRISSKESGRYTTE